VVGQKASAPNRRLIWRSRGELKELVLLMDADNDGKASKQQLIGFMEAEFDRLDKKKEGKLDVKELMQPPPARAFHK
jgi:hypothetical protein